MERHLVTKLPLLLILVIVLPACQDECSCPACNENVTLNSYGSYEFEQEGDDSTARCLVSKCNWHVQGGHNGGVGDTLQVASCGSEGVVFVWAFNDFHALRLAEGWTGQTEEGIRIGDTLNDVLTKNPNFKQSSQASYVISDEDGITLVEANFNNNVLNELIVGSFFRR